MRMAWRAIVATDTLHKALLRTRPHETIPGTTDRVYLECRMELSDAIESACGNTSCQLRSLVQSMVRFRERFRRIAAHYKPEVPLIGVVGEIFCRLNSFSNDDLIRKLEAHGAEAWLSGISEWVSYAQRLPGGGSSPARPGIFAGHGRSCSCAPGPAACRRACVSGTICGRPCRL